ncbi:MAG TPA: hypothetical protein VHB79_23725 [Polyangiaceae bacterium]|nr:hypothetical protein [Polyangiaceae bacterium]
MRYFLRTRLRYAFALATLLSSLSAAAQDRPHSAPPAEAGLAVERLPPSAYPSWQTRGLKGSSLGLSMHGVPWPYYPKTGIGVSGSVWVDFGYETIKRGDPTQSNDKFLLNQSRAVLRTTPTYSNGSWYVQGQSELVANGDQSTAQPLNLGADDLWIRTGEWHSWDIQAGRFEAFEVYHFGMGMDVNTLERKGPTDTTRAPPEVPGLNQFVYRQNVGNLAFHEYISDWLRLELLGQYGFDAGLNNYGVRPAAVFDVGWLKLKAAANIRKQFALSDKSKEQRFRRGGTAAAQLVFDPYIEFGFNYSFELVDHYSPQNAADSSSDRGAFDGLGSVTTTAYGGFANARVVNDLLLGAGMNWVSETDQVQGKFTTQQGFGAIQYLIGQQLYVKFVAGYAKANLHRGDGTAAWQNTMLSGRLRLMYLF